MTAKIYEFQSKPHVSVDPGHPQGDRTAINIGEFIKDADIVRKAGIAALDRAENDMASKLSFAMLISARIRNGHASLEDETLYDFYLLSAGHAMQAVISFRLQLGLPPHPICHAYAIATGHKRPQ